MVISTILEGRKRLPIEICERIIDIALEITPEMLSSAGGMVDRKYTALSCALVCRDWRWRARYHIAQAIYIISPEGILQERERRGQWNTTSRPHLWIDAEESPISCVPVMMSAAITKIKTFTIVSYSHNKIHPKAIHLFSIARQLTTLRLVMFEFQDIHALLSLLVKFPNLRRLYFEIAWIDKSEQLIEVDTANKFPVESRFKRISLSKLVISRIGDTDTPAELNILTYLLYSTSSPTTLVSIDISGCKAYQNHLALSTIALIEACKALQELTLPIHESTDGVIGNLQLKNHANLEAVIFRYKPDVSAFTSDAFSHMKTISEVISTIASRKFHTIRFRISLPIQLDSIAVSTLTGIKWDVIDNGAKEQGVYGWVKEVLFDFNDYGPRNDYREVARVLSTDIARDLSNKLPYVTEKGLLKMGYRRREFYPMQYISISDDVHSPSSQL
ncbi:hypothetical protein ABKN59_007988 [Abortiporus biennis]